MFVRRIRYILVRVCTLILFFNDFKVIPLCFTILISLIFTLNQIENHIFEGEYIEFLEIFQKIGICILIYILFVVSQKIFLNVQKISTDIFLFLIALIFISLQLHTICLQRVEKYQKVQSFIDKNIQIDGYILSRDSESQYTFRSSGGDLGDVTLKIPQYSVIHTGESCTVSGKLVEPESFEDFDYKKYLYRKDIYSILEVQGYECKDGGNTILLFRSGVEEKVNRSLPEPESSLLVGILFGSKRIFTKEFSNALQASGLSHIISASGYNVALLASFVDRIFGRFNGRLIIIIKISVIWMFALIAGLSASIVRASAMSTIYLFALLLGRDTSKGVLILFCITVLICLNPFIMYDIGFLLSSSATVGLIFFPKCFECKNKWIEENLIPTLTCALFTLPVVIYFFGKISVISIITNLIAAPVVQSTIYLGLIATILNMTSSVFRFLYFFPYVQLNIFRYIVEISANIDPIIIESNVDIFVYALICILCCICILKYPISNENFYFNKAKNIFKYTF